MLASPSSRVQDSHRELPHQRVEPEEAQNSYGRKQGALGRAKAHSHVRLSVVSPYIDTCKGVCVSFPRDWELTDQLAAFGQPHHERQAWLSF